MTTERRPLTVLVTADAKQYVPTLAQGLQRGGHRIVSLGGTLDVIRRQHIGATNTLTFLGNKAPALHPEWPERTKRGVIAARLITALLRPRKELEAMGWPVIDAAYINLRPPAAGKLPDTSGLQMLMAGLEGGRLVLCEPEQIKPFVAYLEKRADGSVERPSQFETWLGSMASGYIDHYTTVAHDLAETSPLFDMTRLS